MKVVCRTNLDLLNEDWPTNLPSLPNIGDRIESRTEHKNGFRLQLEVCSITWRCDIFEPVNKKHSEWYPEIELHIPKIRNWSITDFYNWYAPKVGKSLGYFI